MQLPRSSLRRPTAPSRNCLDAERRALAIRAKVNGPYRFLERAATTKRMGLPGSPITMLAEGLRRRIPPQNEISLTAVQGEVASWDSLFDQMTR